MASLKPSICAVFSTRLSKFHDRAVVASLKPPYACQRCGGLGSIPRPRGRGLIEAAPGGVSSRRARSKFHDRAVVASLKRVFCADQLVRSPQFHDRAVVASLKRSGCLLAAEYRFQFHDRAVVASLKRRRRLSSGEKKAEFHDRAVVASLKLGQWTVHRS